MDPYVVAAFVEPVHRKLVFDRSAWPLHLTLTHFSSDVRPDRLAALAAGPVRGALGVTVQVAEDAHFGRSGKVLVSLIAPHPALQQAHEGLIRVLSAHRARITTPAQSMEHFRPHVSVQRGRRVHPEQSLRLRQIGLVEMRPDGDASVRRVFELWESP